MNIGVINGLHPAKEDHMFDRVAALGLTTCQVNIWNSDYYSEALAKKVLDQSAATGVKPCALWAGYSGPVRWNFTEGPITLGVVPEESRERRVNDLKKGADVAKMIGVPAIITHCGFIPENPADPLYPETVDAIREVAGHCRQLGLGFWFETGQETPLTLLRTIEDVGLDNLGVNLDIAFLIVIGKCSIRQIDDELLVKLTDGQVRSVRTVDNLEAVVEQSLALVVDHAQQFNGSPGTA